MSSRWWRWKTTQPPRTRHIGALGQTSLGPEFVQWRRRGLIREASGAISLGGLPGQHVHSIPILRTHHPPSTRRLDHARARDLRAARVQRAYRFGEFGAGGDDVRDGLAVDYCGDLELCEALGGAGHLARFAFRLADPHVLVRAVVAGGGRDGVRHVYRRSGRAGDLDVDGLVGALPHRARLDGAFRGEADAAAGAHRLETRRVRAARGIFGWFWTRRRVPPWRGA